MWLFQHDPLPVHILICILSFFSIWLKSLLLSLWGRGRCEVFQWRLVGVVCLCIFFQRGHFFLLLRRQKKICFFPNIHTRLFLHILSRKIREMTCQSFVWILLLLLDLLEGLFLVGLFLAFFSSLFVSLWRLLVFWRNIFSIFVSTFRLIVNNPFL